MVGCFAMKGILAEDRTNENTGNDPLTSRNIAYAENDMSGAGYSSSSEDGESNMEGRIEMSSQVTASTENSDSSVVTNRLSRGRSRRHLPEMGEFEPKNAGSIRHSALDAVMEQQTDAGDSSYSDTTEENSVSNRKSTSWGPKSEDPFGVENEEHDRNEEHRQVVARNRGVLYARSIEVAMRGRLVMINFSRRGLGPEAAPLVQQVIRANGHLSVMKLCYNRLGDKGATIISSALRLDNGSHHGLVVLGLGFNSIGDDGAGALAVHGIAGNINLTTVLLSGNKIRSNGAMSIAGGMLHGSALRQIHLAANDIGPMGVKAIAGAIAECEAKLSSNTLAGMQSDSKVAVIEELHLGYTSAKSEGFISIPGMLLHNSSLKVLSVAGNLIEDSDISLLSQALTHNKNVPLEQILLSDNNITCAGIENLMNSIWGSTTLKVLKVDRNKLKDRAAQLCAVVLTSVKLEVLEIGFNKVGAVGIKALMKNMSETSSLRHLSLSGIQLDQTGAKAVAYGLANSCSLISLNLDSCLNGYAFQRHVVAGIVSNSNPSLQVITGFAIGPLAQTLGIPKLPARWSNEQVLGFFRFVWNHWRFKSRKGGPEETDATPTPVGPPTVAAAAKVAFTLLGGRLDGKFLSSPQENSPCGRSPVEPACDSLLERLESGTIFRPLADLNLEGSLTDFAGHTQQRDEENVDTAMDTSRQGKNQQWLRLNYRSLHSVGELPYSESDLRQLHEYYFSPSFADLPHVQLPGSPPSATCNWLPRPALPRQQDYGVYSNSFQATTDGHSSHKRPASTRDQTNLSVEPDLKRSKSQQTRMSFFPKSLSKFQALKHKPDALSLLRRLSYIEHALLQGDVYLRPDPSLYPSHADVDMILAELLKMPPFTAILSDTN